MTVFDNLNTILLVFVVFFFYLSFAFIDISAGMSWHISSVVLLLDDLWCSATRTHPQSFPADFLFFGAHNTLYLKKKRKTKGSD